MRWPLKLVPMIATMMILPSIVGAGDVDTIQILKIAPQDQRAVIKTADGKMKIIKVGDVIDSRQETVGRRQ